MANGPPGTDRFIAIVSDNPRDFSNLGTRKNDVFTEFPADVAAKLDRSNTSRAPIFAGEATCAATTECAKSYGAVEFAIDEVAQ